jgi:DNA-binding GntR family transcriptional regulator
MVGVPAETAAPFRVREIVHYAQRVGVITYNRWRMPRMLSAALATNPYRTAQAVVADRLRRAVLSGQMRPGSRLLQAAVAAEMRTSTTPVREAMRELAGEGLLDLDPHRGVVVHQPSLEELQEIYRIRSLLEPVAIAGTIENITPEQLMTARQLLDEMERLSDVAEWALHNATFHSILAEASGMPILTSILEKLRNLSTMYVASFVDRHPDRVRQANDEHRSLLEACEARDVARAQELEVAHLQHTLIIGSDQLPSSREGAALSS